MIIFMCTNNYSTLSEFSGNKNVKQIYSYFTILLVLQGKDNWQSDE